MLDDKNQHAKVNVMLVNVRGLEDLKSEEFGNLIEYQDAEVTRTTGRVGTLLGMVILTDAQATPGSPGVAARATFLKYHFQTEEKPVTDDIRNDTDLQIKMQEAASKTDTRSIDDYTPNETTALLNEQLKPEILSRHLGEHGLMHTHAVMIVNVDGLRDLHETPAFKNLFSPSSPSARHERGYAGQILGLDVFTDAYVGPGKRRFKHRASFVRQGIQ